MDKEIIKIGLLPCAGNATRLNHLPKFLLPISIGQQGLNNNCLLSIWIFRLFKECNCQTIFIPCNPSTMIFVEHILKTDSLINKYLNHIVVVDVGFTETMNKTIQLATKQIFHKLQTNNFITFMGMPDTFITHPLKLLSSDDIQLLSQTKEAQVIAYVWQIKKSQCGKIGQCCLSNKNQMVEIEDKNKNCNYQHGWGFLVWNSLFEQKFIKMEDQHPGYSLKTFLSTYHGENSSKKDSSFFITSVLNSGEYFDCGTLSGYQECLNSKLSILHAPIYFMSTMMIVFAIYALNEEISNIVFKCLKQARKTYPNAVIVAVNNTSPCISWQNNLTSDDNIYILTNTSTLHKYEFGAYLYALQFYRADCYLFLQGTVFINQPFDTKKCIPHLNHVNYEIIPIFSIHALHLYNDDLRDLKRKCKMYQLDYDNWINNPITTIGCNFYCTNFCLEESLLPSGILEIPTQNKKDSTINERIISLFIYGYYNNNIIYEYSSSMCSFSKENLTNYDFYKVYFNQK